MAAEPVLGIVVEAVVSQAFSLAKERISAAWGVEKDLQSLAQKLEMIEAILSDAETKSQNRLSSVQIWLRKLEDATTDAYLLLDEYGYYVLRKQIEKPQILKKMRRCFSGSNPIAFRLKMASNIKEITLQMDGILKEAEQIKLVSDAITVNSSNIDVRKDRIITGPFVTTSEIVGREVDAEKIVTELTSFNNQNDDLPVIGIVGMAGQGKTTLAQLVFNNEEVTRRFEKRIWVCVSDDFIVENFLNDMLQSLTREVSKLTVRQPIVDELKKELKEKRFLLVLDDVWNEVRQKWSDMMTCLQEIGGSKGSRIIVTTRSTQVISIMRPSLTHPLGALTEEESWELFEKIAFPDGEAATTKDLMDEGKKVVQKCCGLPLAIKALAGLMYSNRNASEWSKIVESNIWNSIDPQSSIMPIVKLSYDNLPSLSLKQCFVYCSVFPKDSIIEKQALIQQWMAHGLLNPSQGSKLEMEDIGSNYFQILLQRSLFQDVTFDKFGNINSCKMHDVVHDFVSQASKDRCLIIEDGVQIQDNKALHWCISGNRSIDVTIPFRLRTLLLFNPKSFSFGQIAECKYLCVLLLMDWSLKKLPNSIGKMKYLRNLDISMTGIRRLPNSITKLYNLQTLRVSKLLGLPRDFGSLVKLRHFHIPALLRNNLISFPPEISKMTSLRTLPYFMVSRTCQIKELKSLNNLEGELKIYDLQNVSNREEAMKADLSKKRNILDLELYWRGIRDDDNNHENVLEGLKPHSNLKVLEIFGFAGKNLPSWIQLLDNLVRMELWGLSCCEQITALGQLPRLKVVKIVSMENLKCIGKEFYGVTSSPWSSSFPSLTELSLWIMPSLEKWADPSSDESNIHHGVVFPVLEILEIMWAPKLNQLLNVLNRRIPFLKKLRLHEVNSLEYLSWGSEELSVEELNIWRCYKLSTLSTTGERLKSLRRLHIAECDKLDISQSRIDLCAKLEDLQIESCLSIRLENLRFPTYLRSLTLGLPKDYDGEEFPWPCGDNSFAFLDSLVLYGASSKNIKSFPKQIQHLPALTYLHLGPFDGIEALPEWLCNIPSLQHLRVSYCNNLAYLPSREALQHLTTACQLKFRDCSLLNERCNKRSGPEWDKIKDLPNIHIS